MLHCGEGAMFNNWRSSWDRP